MKQIHFVTVLKKQTPRKWALAIKPWPGSCHLLEWLHNSCRSPIPHFCLLSQLRNKIVLSWSYFWIKWSVDSRECAQRERGNTRGGATKKREISHNLLSINLNFSVLEIASPKPLCSLARGAPPRAREHDDGGDWSQWKQLREPSSVSFRTFVTDDP